MLGFSFDYTSDTDDHGVGTVHGPDENGNTYRWVEFVDQDAAVSEVVYPATTDLTQVTTDYTGGSATAAKVCGVTVATAVDISVAKYGFVQISGSRLVRTDGSVSAGEALVGHTVDGEADTMADGEEELVFGFALETDSGSPTTSRAMLNC